MTDRAEALRAGVIGLAKCVVAAVGVPVAIDRLWEAIPSGGALVRPGEPGSWAHLLLLLVAALWLVAMARIARELVAAVRGEVRPGPGGWSARWAGAVAGLLALVAAGGASAHGARPASTPVAAAAPAPSATTATGPRCVVGPHECLADVAARTLGEPDRWPLLAAFNLGRVQTDGTTFVDANLLRPGWELVLPTGPDAPTVPVADHSGRLPELALVGLGILGTAALARRARLLRRANGCLRRAGERFPSADRADARLSHAIAPFGKGLLLDWLEVANRLLGAQEDRVPPVRVVRAGPAGVELLLDEVVPLAPLPFLAEDGGKRWRLPSDGDLSELSALAGRARPAFPALLPLGEDDRACYLLPLGPGRRLGLLGPDDAVDAALAAFLAALRTLPWCAELSVELLGVVPPPISEGSHHLHASSPATLRALADARPGGDHREDLLVLAGRESADEPEIERLASRAGLLLTGQPGRESLVLGRGSAVLEPEGLRLRVPLPAPGQVGLVDRLLDAAARPSRPAAALPAAQSASVTQGPAEIRLLAPRPWVIGGTGELDERDAGRVTELLALLVLRGGRLTLESLAAELIGRTGPGAEALVRRYCTAAERALGDGAGGRLLRVDRGEARLDPTISCDWLRFGGHLAAARVASPEEAAVLLRRALDLVEGSPLAEASPGWGWAAAADLPSTMAAAILDAAHQLTLLELAAGRLEEAGRAITAGRRVEPDAELLLRDLMVLHETAGDRAAAHRVYVELETVLERLGPYEPSEETRALAAALAEADLAAEDAPPSL